jgi:hypothetical protein
MASFIILRILLWLFGGTRIQHFLDTMRNFAASKDPRGKPLAKTPLTNPTDLVTEKYKRIFLIGCTGT